MALFGTAGIRGSARDVVTPELALSVGRAAGGAADASEFVLARDGRRTGPALVDALAAGLESAGIEVRRAGQLPTPALAFASRGRHAAMVTASHNPPGDNGIKLFRDGVEYGAEAERRVEARLGRPKPTAPATPGAWGGTERVAVLPTYRETVAAYACEHGAPLDGLAVAIDCGNGTGALATPQMLSTIGAEVAALNANVDGRFPGRDSKPTPESIADLRAFMASGYYALGIAHDGDADRVVVVDADGEVVHEDTVLAVLAEHYVRRSDAEDPVVVTTPNASSRVDERVEAAGGRTERVALGFLHEGIGVARQAGGNVVFAGEPWKHIHPALGGWIDGVASAAVLCRLVADAGGIDPLHAPVTELPYRKMNVGCPDGHKGAVMTRLLEELPGRFPDADVDPDYGVRLNFADGSWTLVRPSGTEPYIRIYAEGDDVDKLVGEVREIVETAVAAGN